MTIQPPAELISYLDTLAEPHILCDRDYRILAANKAYFSRYSTSNAIVGQTCYAVSHRFATPCDEAGEVCPLKRSISSGQRERVLHLHHTPAGEAYVEIELVPVRNAAGELVYFVEKIEPYGIVGKPSEPVGLIGRAPAFRRMLELVARGAPSDAAVMLLGESGTGKELVARAIHDASRRANRPFVAVDCSGLTETLFESELFGHERGAFTGAASRRIGLVEAASGGTLFLDELGDIPLGMQVKLLRLLETGTFRRVGGNEFRQADVRVVSATHRDVRAMVAEGRFRQDLFYRLNTFQIALPPLRARREDIPLLAEALLKRVAAGRDLGLAEETLAILMTYDYPGNVRELRNVLERASLLCDGNTILPAHLPPEVFGLAMRPAEIGAERTASFVRANGHNVSGTLAQLSETALRQRLASYHGSRKALARELGISERTLYRKLNKLRQGTEVLP